MRKFEIYVRKSLLDKAEADRDLWRDTAGSIAGEVVHWKGQAEFLQKELDAHNAECLECQHHSDERNSLEYLSQCNDSLQTQLDEANEIYDEL